MLIISVQQILFLIFMLAVFAGIIVLQVFLSKKESKWLGLILPGITFGISVLLFLVVLFNTAAATMQMVIALAFFAFLIFNIPTGILLAIYGGCRSKRNKQRALEKMSAQDLE